MDPRIAELQLTRGPYSTPIKSPRSGAGFLTTKATFGETAQVHEIKEKPAEANWHYNDVVSEDWKAAEAEGEERKSVEI